MGSKDSLKEPVLSWTWTPCLVFVEKWEPLPFATDCVSSVN